jgi:glycerol-3-phosphate O-acyltransferase 3/4
MSSWAIVCDVWYLPPMTRKPEESAVDFANRVSSTEESPSSHYSVSVYPTFSDNYYFIAFLQVKGAIARKGGLVDLDWDGQLKRAPAKKEWKEQQQLEYSKKFTNVSPRKQINLIGSNNSNYDSPNPST